MPASGDTVKAAAISDLENNTIRRSIARLVQQATQSLANATNVPLTFGAGSEEIDTDNQHDTAVNNTRITPLKPGYYRVFGCVNVAASAALTILTAFIAKNAIAVQPFLRTKPGGANTTCGVFVEATVSMDGITDYVELYGNQTSGGALGTQASGGVNSTFELEYLRPL